MKNHYVDVLPANRYLFIYLFILFISSVWWFIQRSLGSARTNKPFIPCTLVALVLWKWKWKMENAPVNIVCAMNVLKL